MKLIYSVLFSFILFLIFPILNNSQVTAQTCSGSRTCLHISTVCTPTDCLPGSPGCSCSDVPNYYNVACSGIPPSGTCTSSPCIVGDSVSSDSCGPVPPAASCGCGGGETTQCCNTSCTDGSGNPCSCYGVCSGNTCTQGGIVPGSCAVPTTTPPPGCTITSTYCGSACVSCGVTSDNYLDTCGNCVQTATYTGNWCGAPCGGGGSTPAPTTPPSGCDPVCGCGAHADSSLCGGCCADGTTCTSQAGGTYACLGSGGGGGGGCFFGSAPFSTCQSFACVQNNTGACGISTCTANSDCTCGDGICQAYENSSTCSADCSVTLNGRVFLDLNKNSTYEPADTNCPISSSTFFPTTVSSCISSGYATCGPYSAALSQCYWDSTGNGFSNSDQLCPSGLSVAQCQSNGFTTCSGGPFGCFNDRNSNGSYDATGETGVSNPSLSLSPADSGALSTTANGSYTFSTVPKGNHTLTLASGSIPAGYASSVTNPVSLPLNANTTYNFPLQAVTPPPACTPGSISLNPAGGTANPGGTVTLSVTSCTNVENPNDGVPPPPFTWNPDTGGNNPPPTVSGQTDTPTSSTTTWTAPACPLAQTTYTPQVTIGGPGGTTNYTTSITVPSTVTVTANVRDVSGVGACNSSSGVAYNNGGTGATLNITNGGSVNQNQTTNSGTGATAFTCLPQGSYQLSLQVPSGYAVIGTDVTPAVESPLGSNGVSFATGSSNQVATFCIAPLDPWFQTSVGDVRFLNLSNPVPSGLKASTDADYPGIFYSSDSNANLGRGAASVKNWVINNEYSYNADTENRNGGMSYDFYKSKTKQDGVTITQISSGTFDQTQITGSGVYEAPGDLTINLYTHVNGRRVVILVNGNVTINASTISIPQNQGIFIVAAKGNITIGKTVGTATLNSTASNIDGYYTAQGSIILDGDTCADGTTSDLRLNIGGTLVANSLKPFSTTGTGTLQNKRSLCTNNLLYPSLYINARPDFITQLTDFYKTTYTKWQEVNP